MSKKIAVVSLGCDKNRVDTEKMLWYLSDGDYVVVADYAEADVIIVNTCAFIESARKEAIETILEMSRYKTVGRCKKLIATGCLVEKYREELEKEMPEVDAFWVSASTKKYALVSEKTYLRQSLRMTEYLPRRRITHICELPTVAIIFARSVQYRLFAASTVRERSNRLIPKRKNFRTPG